MLGGGPSTIVTPPMCMCETGALLVQERGVHRSQPVEVALAHGLSVSGRPLQ